MNDRIRFRLRDLAPADRAEHSFIPTPQYLDTSFSVPEDRWDWGLKMLSVPDAWHYTRGEGIRVAILDTGVDRYHIDLAENIKEVRDFTGSSECVADSDGHGTHVAGIIGAVENGHGISGIAPEVDLVIGRVLRHSRFGKISWLIDGIEWAIDQDVQIISLSLSTKNDHPALRDVIQKAIDKGIFVLCAAGNRGSSLDTVDYPAKYCETLTVGSIDVNKEISRFSSRGSQVDIVAPGQDVWSTFPSNTYGKLSGTSMSTPFAAGIVALMLSKHKDHPNCKTPVTDLRDLRAHLHKVSEDLGAFGKDSHYGHGLLDPSKLLRL